MSNLRKFAVSQTTRLHLRDASENLMYADGQDGKPDHSKPIAANLYGPASKEYAKAQSAQNNRLMNRLKQKGKVEQTAEQKSQEDADFLADITISFENLEPEKATTTDRAMIIAQYLDAEIGFVRDQVAKHVNDWSNFTKPSATN
jgi:hypothetical protein